MTVEELLISAVVGVLIPLITDLASKANVSSGLKALIAALLASAAGILNGTLTSPPKGVGAWEAVLLAVGVAWVASLTSYLAAWKPSGVSTMIEAKTARIGVGRPQVAAPPYEKAA